MNEHEQPSTDETARPRAARARHGRLPRSARIATGTVLAAGLGASGFAVAGAVAGTSGAATSLASLTSATTRTAPGGPNPGGATNPGGPVIWRGTGAGGPGMPGIGRGLAGTISALGSGSMTLTTPAGTSVTVTLGSSTTYREGRTTLSSSDLRVGAEVVVVPTATTAAAASPTAATVAVVGPRIVGRVVSVSGYDVVVADRQGFYRTVVTSSSTTVTEAGGASNLGAVVPGTAIDALGTIAADHTDLNASTIRIVLPHLVGRVTAVDTSTGTLTLATPGASAATSVTTTTTTRFQRGTSSTTLSAIPVGSFVVVSGTPGTGSTFAAVQVSVLTGGGRLGAMPGPGFAGPGFGGPGFGVGPASQ